MTIPPGQPEAFTKWRENQVSRKPNAPNKHDRHALKLRVKLDGVLEERRERKELCSD